MPEIGITRHQNFPNAVREPTRYLPSACDVECGMDWPLTDENRRERLALVSYTGNFAYARPQTGSTPTLRFPQTVRPS